MNTLNGLIPCINFTKTTKNSMKPARVKNRLSTDDFSRIKTSLIAHQGFLVRLLIHKGRACFISGARRTVTSLGNTQLPIYLQGICGVMAK